MLAALAGPASLPPAPAVAPALRPLLETLAAGSALEEASGVGRWWHEPHSDQALLSPVAARLLGVRAGLHARLRDCLPHASTETEALRAAGEQEFSVHTPSTGLRWLRALPLPADAAPPGLVAGILQDITPLKLAAVRERLGFELTEYLVGTQTLGEVIVSVIQLICKNLGWEWGAYWALERGAEGRDELVCRHWWQRPGYEVGGFGEDSASLRMRPGEGLVGSVWLSGQATWVEDVSTDRRFLRRQSARGCGLWSGYVFPVSYASADGEPHRPGVLEFYSSLARQPEAQLPRLSATIGALIAQTAQRLEQEACIRHLAQVDELTGLANRSHFYLQLERECARSAKTGGAFGLMFIDLDRFKPINDAFGHEAGNWVLREFARRLQALAPAGAGVGRLGGDEFALMLPGQDAAALAALAERVLEAARSPFAYEGLSLGLSASIGISRFPDNGLSGPELLRSADAAMYRVKQDGRNGCREVFSTSTPSLLAQQQATLAQRLTIETELRQALQGDELFLEYQPIFDLEGQRLHAVEALLRWRRADGERVSPELFIPIAEQSHLIVEIGHWVAARACRDLAELQRAGLGALRVHVNMAAPEFGNAALPEALLQRVRAHGLQAQQLSLELTEGMLMRRPEQVIPVMHALRRAGFDISLDDFGMGHSSLSLLRSLPISSLKIDRSFVRELAGQGRDLAIARTIIDLGRHLDLEVIAEGIETPAQLALLAAQGCHLVQGYLLSRPLGLVELIERFPQGVLSAPPSSARPS